MGLGVSLNYQGSAGFGTVLGGCCSLLVSMFIGVFTTIQLYGWLFAPSYNQLNWEDYMHPTVYEPYEIQTK